MSRILQQHSLVGVHAAGNPFLRPVNDPVLPVFGLRGGGLETEHVRPSVSLGNGEADEFLPSKYFGKHFLLKFLGTEVHNRGETNDQTAQNTCRIPFSQEKGETSERMLTVTVTTVATTYNLLRGDELVEGVKLGVFHVSSPSMVRRKAAMYLFWSNETVHEFQTLQVLAWTQGHCKQVKFAVYNGHQLT